MIFRSIRDVKSTYKLIYLKDHTNSLTLEKKISTNVRFKSHQPLKTDFLIKYLPVRNMSVCGRIPISFCKPKINNVNLIINSKKVYLKYWGIKGGNQKKKIEPLQVRLRKEHMRLKFNLEVYLYTYPQTYILRQYKVKKNA